MSSDGDHGPQGRYPESWSPENGDVGPSTPPNTAVEALPPDKETSGESGEIVVDGLQDDDVDQDGDVDELEKLEFGDAPADASEYECAECGDSLEYHQEECSCGESPMWRVAVAE